jgi:pyruvate dehydrogenase E2 component (dihydrolipoamide acetyltransferase)
LVSGLPGSGPAVVSPVVRRLAFDLGVNLMTIEGTGPRGLILRRDVEAAAAAFGGSPSRLETKHGWQASTPVRAAVSKLVRSRREIPDVTTWVDADATGILEAKAALTSNADHAAITLLGLLARICVFGLTQHRLLNGRYDSDHDTVILNDSVHLGVAVATARGLLVPVVRDAQLLNTADLCAKVSETVDRARNGVLSTSQVTGGTFTLNNYGGFNVDGSTPIINYPEVAILGIGRIMDRAWVVAGAVVVRPVVTLSLAYDHRVCDGRDAAAFLGSVRENIEAPTDVFGEI